MSKNESFVDRQNDKPHEEPPDGASHGLQRRPAEMQNTPTELEGMQKSKQELRDGCLKRESDSLTSVSAHEPIVNHKISFFGFVKPVLADDIAVPLLHIRPQSCELQLSPRSSAPP